MIDDEVRQALDVDPSPAFLARVRSRIDAEPAPSAWRASWRFVAAGAVAAGIVVGILVSRPLPSQTPRPDMVKAFTPEHRSAATPPGAAIDSVSPPQRS